MSYSAWSFDILGTQYCYVLFISSSSVMTEQWQE